MDDYREVAGQDYADRASFQKQIEVLRRLSGEERLGIAFEMWRIACRLAYDGIRAQNPDYSPTQASQELARRIMIANGSARIISTHRQNPQRD